MDNDDIVTWAREQERLRGDPAPDEQPTTVLRNCANRGCRSQNNRRALIFRYSGHDLCTVCQRFARVRMRIRRDNRGW